MMKRRQKQLLKGLLLVVALLALRFFPIENGTAEQSKDYFTEASESAYKQSTEVTKTRGDEIEIPPYVYAYEEDTEETEVNVIVDLPDQGIFDGRSSIVVNDNVPYFDSSEITTESFESYSELDELGRCQAAIANVGQDIMPTEERGNIGSVKPTGWHTIKYDIVDGTYRYNRCHLIGYQLTGENANNKNLITGTRYLNVEGMLPYENMIADYVKETGNHVLYRVTPLFHNDNLVASGVLMEALSVEDDGAGIQFCVYCPNVQPGIVIDYVTGDSYEE